jgi:hypothetical protein
MAGVWSIWPWLAVAGLGALHGLNPASGWMFAAAWSMRSGDRALAWRALLPIAAGHAASVALVAVAVAAAATLGPSVDLVALQIVSVGLVAVIAMACLARQCGHHHRHSRDDGSPVHPGHVGLAIWSFVMSSVHGAGLMLVPALMPLCIGDASVREITASGSLLPALAAVGVHMAAMLAVTGVMATGACRGLEAFRSVFARRASS